MKLPIVSRKKYEILQNNINLLNKQRMEITKKYQELQKEFNEQRKTNIDLGNEIDEIIEKLKNTRKEIANLKRTLTKNGIEYKKVKNEKQ